MRRILVPTDFSPTAEKAFRFAADIASKTGGSLVLYHVYTPEEVPLIETEERKRANARLAETVQVKRLNRLKKKVITPDMNVPVSTIVGRPPIISDLVRFTRHNDIELIVMGTKGASGLTKIVAGSVASNIIEKSPVPVLVLPEKSEWKSPEQIVFASNYHPDDRRALSLTLELAKVYHARVTVLHLSTTDSMLQENGKQDFYSYAYDLQRTFQDSKLGFKEIKTTHLVADLENLQNIIPYDLLVMVRRKKKFLEKWFLKNFSANMACMTTRPLLVIPAKE